MITGPFLPETDYLGEVLMNFTPENRKYVVEITESDLNKYKFMRFKVRQDLHFFHGDTVFIYLQTTKSTELLFVKPTPTQVYEYLEYRVRLSSEKFSGTTGAKLIFMYHGCQGAQMDLQGLYFGPTGDDDVVILPTGITISVFGAGISSPLPGYNPISTDEIVDIQLFPYNGAKLKKVVFTGDVYDASGAKYPSVIYESRFAVKYQNMFENVHISAYFGGV